MYDVTKWYWVVGGDETRVWSSAERAYVPITDSAYCAFVEGGNFPTRIADEASLVAVVNQPVIEQIAWVETKQLRPLREISLGIDVSANQTRIADLDAAIAGLRSALFTVPLGEA